MSSPGPSSPWPRVAGALAGPEVFWLALCAVVWFLAARNEPPTPAGNAFLERFWWLLPLVCVPLTFAAFLYSRGRWWLLLRIDLACLAGLYLAVWRVSEAIDYQDSRNSGVGTGFIMSLLFGVVVLTAANVGAAMLLLIRGRG